MGKFHKGLRLRSRKSVKVDGVITFGAPCCGRFEGVLPAGEVLKLNYEPHDRVRGLWLEPERYSDLEQVFVPKESRSAPAYSGYAVGCDYDQIAVDFEVLDEQQAA
ncbi:MAG TPA: hypothetical protein VMB80_13040 [Candidatus Acidoferrum sp.]|nr:hypothetical protein [Candidatus Acidoferrum sp.]